MMSDAVQQARASLADFTVRRVLAAWKGQAAAVAAERAAKAEQLCRLRVQEARKTDIASKFHRVWQLHSALKAWQAAARESMSTRAAQAQAALQEAAIAARMEIAAQFHNNFQLHAAMDAWRRAASSSQQERQASHQAQVVQSRTDAVLTRVKAGRRDEKSPWARTATAERGGTDTRGEAADARSAKISSDAREKSGTEGKVTDGCAIESLCPSVHSEDDATGCSHPVSTAGGADGELVQHGLFSMTAAQVGVSIEQSREGKKHTNEVMPYPEAESTTAGGSGEILLAVVHALNNYRAASI